MPDPVFGGPLPPRATQICPIPRSLRRTTALWLCSLGICTAQSAELSIPKAIELALQNHPLVQTAQIDSSKANTDLSLGNAGYMPKVDLIASVDLLDTNLVKDPSSTQGAQASLQATWTLFEGMRSPSVWKRLELTRDQSLINLALTRDNIALQTASAWLDVFYQQELLRALSIARQNSELRFQIAKTRVNTGAASPLETIQAEQELNTKISDESKQVKNLQSAKTRLGQWLGQALPDSIRIPEPTDSLANFEILKAQLVQNNKSQKINQINQAIAAVQIDESQAKFWPQVQLILGYTVKPDGSPTNATLARSKSGASATLQANWNLFDGFESSRLRQNAQISLRNSQIKATHLQSDLEIQLGEFWRDYQNAKERIKFEQRNQELSQQSLSLSMDRYQSGRGTTLEISEAQKNDALAMARLISTKIELHSARFKINALCGQFNP